MPKDTFYFSHDYNSRSDKEMVKVIMKMGMSGIGIYWCIVEMLYEEGGYLMRTEYERIAFELRTECERIAFLIETFNLFKFDDKKFWSNSVLDRLNKRKNKSIKARESANYRWSDANALRSHSKRNAIKESKVNNNSINNVNKEINNKENINILSNNLKSANEKKFICPEMLKIFQKNIPKYIPDPERDFEPLLSIATFFHKHLGLNTPISDLNPEILALWDVVGGNIAKHDFYSQKSLKTISNHIQEILNITINGKSTSSIKQNRSELSSTAIIRPDKTYNTIL